MSQDIVFGVSDFIAVFNQTVNYAYPEVTIVGELANFRVSKNRWIYFDLKDEEASVRFFGTVYNLKTPLEDGMLLTVRGMPQLHPQFGFSLTVQTITLSGEGTIERAFKLLEAKLRAEGLFELSRKRHITTPPARIGLVTSSESAAFSDFVKIINERWGQVVIDLFDVQVQGENAPGQIVQAIEYFNTAANTPDIIVVTRGGGSADDLQAFNTEQITRAVAMSRIPTMVAIGHERDISLAELAADYRASTPSNAAQMLVPERLQEQRSITATLDHIQEAYKTLLKQERTSLQETLQNLAHQLQTILQTEKLQLATTRELLTATHPAELLRRGYAIVRGKNGNVLTNIESVKQDDEIAIQLQNGIIQAVVKGTVQ